jgi:dynein light chain 1
LTQAIKAWETKNQTKSEEATEVKLICQIPPISKLDNSLANLKRCEFLSLSTNTIDRIPSLVGMGCLRVLSLGRNNIKKIEKVEDVAGTLEQLWLSYNSISSLDGMSSLTKLTNFYCSNNLIKSFNELDKIVSKPSKVMLFVAVN